MTRGVPVSRDLRLAIVNMYCLNIRGKKLARYSGVPLRTVQRIVAFFNEHGDVGGDKPRTGRKCMLSKADIEFLVATVLKTPDLQLADLRRRLEIERNVPASISTIWRGLQKAGYSLKVITKAARERDWERRAEFIDEISQYQPHELVFIDESSFDRRTSIRNKAWGVVGKRVVKKVFFHRGARYSLLPALSLDGILHVSTTPGSYNTELFNEFIRELVDLMNPYHPVTHPSNSVIVLDNCRIHKDPAILEYIEERGMHYVFLLPYSPDYNPIELTFSSLKACFKKHRDAVEECWNDEERAQELLIQLTFRVTPAMAAGWFTKAGY